MQGPAAKSASRGCQSCQCLSLSQALEGEQLKKTMEILEDYFLVTHASMSSGKSNPAVQQFRLLMLEHASKYCSPRQTDFLSDLVLQCSVTLDDLLETKGASAGVLGVFPEVVREHIPDAPALLEHILAEAEAARPRKRVREVPEEPDELFCDENISDRGREEKSTDSAHDKPASGEEASAEDESGVTTPKPKGMSERDIELINRAPFKQQRGDQD